MDVCKIGAGLYQYTGINDCWRYQVVGVFPRKTAASTLTFLDRSSRKCRSPFNASRQTVGQEFFAYPVPDRLRAWSIQFWPIRPSVPSSMERLKGCSAPLSKSSGLRSI